MDRTSEEAEQLDDTAPEVGRVTLDLTRFRQDRGASAATPSEEATGHQQPLAGSLTTHYMQLHGHRQKDSQERRYVEWPIRILITQHGLDAERARIVVDQLCAQGFLFPDATHRGRMYLPERKKAEHPKAAAPPIVPSPRARRPVPGAPPAPESEETELRARIAELEERLADVAGLRAVLDVKEQAITELRSRATDLEVRAAQLAARNEELTTQLAASTTYERQRDALSEEARLALMQERDELQTSHQAQVAELEQRIAELEAEATKSDMRDIPSDPETEERERRLADLEEQNGLLEARLKEVAENERDQQRSERLPLVVRSEHRFGRGRRIWLSDRGVTNLFTSAMHTPVSIRFAREWLEQHRDQIATRLTRDEHGEERLFYAQGDIAVIVLARIS